MVKSAYESAGISVYSHSIKVSLDGDVHGVVTKKVQDVLSASLSFLASNAKNLAASAVTDVISGTTGLVSRWFSSSNDDNSPAKESQSLKTDNSSGFNYFGWGASSQRGSSTRYPAIPQESPRSRASPSASSGITDNSHASDNGFFGYQLSDLMEFVRNKELQESAINYIIRELRTIESWHGLDQGVLLNWRFTIPIGNVLIQLADLVSHSTATAIIEPIHAFAAGEIGLEEGVFSPVKLSDPVCIGVCQRFLIKKLKSDTSSEINRDFIKEIKDYHESLKLKRSADQNDSTEAGNTDMTASPSRDSKRQRK